jgi:hypothetical protein
MKKTILIVLCLLLLQSINNLHGQDNSELAKKYFSKYHNNKAITELCLKSLPTLEECKLIFKGHYAIVYYSSLEDWKKKLNEQLTKEDIKFTNGRVEYFTAEDIEHKKGNYPLAMQVLENKLQPGVAFYDIIMLKNKGDKSGVDYKSVVYLNGKWIFFPKPWIPFIPKTPEKK